MRGFWEPIVTGGAAEFVQEHTTRFGGFCGFGMKPFDAGN